MYVVCCICKTFSSILFLRTILFHHLISPSLVVLNEHHITFLPLGSIAYASLLCHIVHLPEHPLVPWKPNELTSSDFWFSSPLPLGQRVGMVQKVSLLNRLGIKVHNHAQLYYSHLLAKVKTKLSIGSSYLFFFSQLSTSSTINLLVNSDSTACTIFPIPHFLYYFSATLTFHCFFHICY